MKNYFTADEIEKVAQGGKILRDTLHTVVGLVQPGVTGVQLNQAAEALIKQAGAKPAFKGYGQPPYPNALCVSINDCVVHGIATDKPLNDGDIVTLDLGVVYQGYYTDMAMTVPVGTVSKETTRLITVTREALQLGLDVIRPGIKTGAIGQAVQSYVEKHGFSVIREFTGHGVGKAVHQEPSIPNYGKPQDGVVLEEGMILAIEPMVAQGDWRVVIAPNHWDVMTADHSLAAHWEQTVAVTADGYRILT
jgi:methionyl aminopeptidase